MIARRVRSRIRQRVSGVSTRHLLHPLVLTIIVSAMLGGASGDLIATAGSGDRVTIGNTGGTLSGVVQAGGAVIVIGGGNARTDLADLVGRSTVPWRHRIDLLIVPGWDDQQSIGALGLMERGGVAEIVIAGQPGDTPVWNALQQAAAREGIPVTVVSGRNVIDIAPGVVLELEAGEPSTGATDEFAVAALRYHQSTLTFVDASKAGLQAMTANNISLDQSHILAAVRPLTSVFPHAEVLFQARATAGSDLSAQVSPFAGEIRSGQHVTVRLTKSELRLPLAAVTGYGTGAFSSTPPSAASP